VKAAPLRGMAAGLAACSTIGIPAPGAGVRGPATEGAGVHVDADRVDLYEADAGIDEIGLEGEVSTPR
jgi:hypothetical protein